MAKKTFKAKVQRYNPDIDDEPYFQEFDVEFEPGMTVFDDWHLLKRF